MYFSSALTKDSSGQDGFRLQMFKFRFVQPRMFPMSIEWIKNLLAYYVQVGAATSSYYSTLMLTTLHTQKEFTMMWCL